MRPLTRVLLTLAAGGWLVAGISHVRSHRTIDEVERARLTLRRDRCLLVSSLSMNSLVAITLYRYARKRMQQTKRS